MITLDSSSILAIELREPGFQHLLTKIANDPECVVGAPTVLESAVVLSQRGVANAYAQLEAFLLAQGVEVLDFSDLHSKLALEAYERFGKGRHPAKLNLGDCMAYAIARATGSALLFVGNEFSQTDIRIA